MPLFSITYIVNLLISHMDCPALYSQLVRTLSLLAFLTAASLPGFAQEPPSPWLPGAAAAAWGTVVVPHALESESTAP